MALNWIPSDSLSQVVPLTSRWVSPGDRMRGGRLDPAIFGELQVDGAEEIALSTTDTWLKIPTTVAGGEVFQVDVDGKALLVAGSLTGVIVASAEGEDDAECTLSISVREPQA